MRLPDCITDTWWKAYETVAYDWHVPLRLAVIRRALDPRLTELEIEVLMNHEFIERNHRIREQHGSARAYSELMRFTDPGKPYALKTVADVHQFAGDLLDNADTVIRLINDQWSDQAGIDRYPADHPNNFSEYSRNRPNRR